MFTNENNIMEDGETNLLHTIKCWNSTSTSTGSLTNDPFISMNGTSSNILVAVRVRPESAREKAERKSSSIVRVLDKNVLVFDPSDDCDVDRRRALGLRRGKELRFAFDRVFDENSTQLEVYENSAKALLESVLDGYNATVFAYGATGAGKTFTMFGSEVSGPGILPLTIIDLFRMMERSRNEKSYKVTVSFLEVYNEQIFDLLAPEGNKSSNHEIREDKVKGIIVSGLSEHLCQNADQALELIQRGIANRTQFGTAANSQSSRSHGVFQINVQQMDRTANIKADIGIGKLSLIDLAGSERASVTQNRGARLVEGANINKSLLALSNCINALGRNKGKGYVPYRNSKLTRLLKDSLGGNCKTVMIANISPSDLSYDDSYNTLKYANRAKTIKTVVKKNIHNVSFHISKYTKIIDELRKEVNELKIQLTYKEMEKSSINTEKNEQYEKERIETENIRTKLSQVFYEQMKNRRSLLELEEQDRQNSLQVMAISNEIERWEKEHPNEDKPLRIHTRQKDAETLILAKKEYAFKKESIERVLQENLLTTKSIQDTVPKLISNNELRQLIDLQVKNHDQDILSLDLERMVEHHKAKVQRMALVLEDAHFCTTKVHDVLRVMFDKLKQCDLLTPEIEGGYTMACSLLEKVDKQAVNYNDDKLYDPIVEAALKTPKSIHTGARRRKNSLQNSSLFQLHFPNDLNEKDDLNSLGTKSKTTNRNVLRSKTPIMHSPRTVKYNNFVNEISPTKPKGTKVTSPKASEITTINNHLRTPTKNDKLNMSVESDDAMVDEIEDNLSKTTLEQHRLLSPLKKNGAENTQALREKFERFRSEYFEAANGGTYKLKITKKKTTPPKPPSANGSINNNNLLPNPSNSPSLNPKPVKIRKIDSENIAALTKLKSKKVKFAPLPLESNNEPLPNDSPISPTSSKTLPSYMATTVSSQSRVINTVKKKLKERRAIPSVYLSEDNASWIQNLRGSNVNNKENHLNHTPSSQKARKKPSSANSAIGGNNYNNSLLVNSPRK
ncbi:hypothetical protein ABK040_008318 [Willaertia magna]